MTNKHTNKQKVSPPKRSLKFYSFRILISLTSFFASLYDLFFYTSFPVYSVFLYFLILYLSPSLIWGKTKILFSFYPFSFKFIEQFESNLLFILAHNTNEKIYVTWNIQIILEYVSINIVDNICICIRNTHKKLIANWYKRHFSTNSINNLNFKSIFQYNNLLKMQKLVCTEEKDIIVILIRIYVCTYYHYFPHFISSAKYKRRFVFLERMSLGNIRHKEMRGMKSEEENGGENKQQALATSQPSHPQVHTHTCWWEGGKYSIHTFIADIYLNWKVLKFSQNCFLNLIWSFLHYIKDLLFQRKT